jgi:phosphohistidine phosphatase SixA
MIRVILLVLGLASLSAAAAAQTPAPPSPLIDVAQPTQRLPVAELIERLREGGNILLIRHERTEVPSVADDYSAPHNDCTRQRNLSAAGFASARETQTVFRALGVRASRTLTSPMCRTTETARQMFVTFAVDPRLMHEVDETGRTNDVAGRDLASVLNELGSPSGSVAVVTHAGLIMRATGLFLSEGEIAILRRDPAGQWVLVRQIMGSDLAPHAREALGPVNP